jgi:hypothetical protein
VKVIGVDGGLAAGTERGLVIRHVIDDVEDGQSPVSGQRDIPSVPVVWSWPAATTPIKGRLLAHATAAGRDLRL